MGEGAVCMCEGKTLVLGYRQKMHLNTSTQEKVNTSTQETVLL